MGAIMLVATRIAMAIENNTRGLISDFLSENSGSVVEKVSVRGEERQAQAID